MTQQERGLDVSTQSWREAIKHAEGLVELSERKLVREKNAYGRRVAKYEVMSHLTRLLLLQHYSIADVSPLPSSLLRVMVFT